MKTHLLTQDPLHPAQTYRDFACDLPTSTGGAVMFTGLVRDLTPTPLTAMTLECYPAMADAVFTNLHAHAMNTWSLTAAHLSHRYGRLVPADTIVIVLAAAPHRADAFTAARWLIDQLKTEAPFWKREETPTSHQWVEP